MTKPAKSEVSLQASLRGWTVEFDDYFVSVYPTNKNKLATDEGYAACRQIAKAAEFAKAVGYNELTDWAKATVRLKNPDSADYMQEDIWGFWHDWRDSMDSVFGSEFARFEAWPNHSKETVSVEIQFKAGRFERDGYNVEVRRVHYND